jgi:tRNA threonylcarbamoyladenosine biosynthesis protein TsaB
VLILTIRTDKPEAELGLYDDETRLDYISWQAHLELSKTIHSKIAEILNKSSKSLNDIKAIICFEGPGSFTGLRIGLSVANALAYAQSIPIVSRSGKAWIEDGIKAVHNKKNDKIAVPKYGSPPHITAPKK